jgi:ABC-2 type transport system permease protein
MPSTWFVIAALQLVFAWFFLAQVDTFLQIQPQLAQLANPPRVTATVSSALFNTVAILLMILTPMFTMRLIAEERHNQTFALLLAAPLSDAQIVLGKFIGTVVFLSLLASLMPLMLCTLAIGTDLDHGLILSNLLGLILLVACYVALGLYVSSITSQPIIAAIGALATLVGLWLADTTTSAEDSLWHSISPLGHYQNLNAGLIDSSDLAFLFLFTTAFLQLTMRRLSNSRRYG